MECLILRKSVLPFSVGDEWEVRCKRGGLVRSFRQNNDRQQFNMQSRGIVGTHQKYEECLIKVEKHRAIVPKCARQEIGKYDSALVPWCCGAASSIPGS